LPDNDQILAELIQARDETLVSVIHKLINSIWHWKEFPDLWMEPSIVPAKGRVIKLTALIIVESHCYQCYQFKKN
jgi:hypothetical protein